MIGVNKKRGESALSQKCWYICVEFHFNRFDTRQVLLLGFSKNSLKNALFYKIGGLETAKAQKKKQILYVDDNNNISPLTCFYCTNFTRLSTIFLKIVFFLKIV